jgi:AbrB family looped-hinge helix DNA binding protein
MQQATLTSKGQISIPKLVRDSLALHPGDKIEFILTKNNELMLKRKHPHGRGEDTHTSMGAQ